MNEKAPDSNGKERKKKSHSRPIEVLNGERQETQDVLQRIRADEIQDKEERTGLLFARLVELGYLDQADSLAEKLFTLERQMRRLDPGYDLLALSEEELKQEITTLLEDVDSVAQTATETTYQDFLNLHKDKPAIEVIRLGIDSEDVPETEKAKFRDYLRLASPKLVENAQDRTRIETKINGLSLAELPAIDVFITTSVFEDAEISEETKVAVAAEFGLSREEIVTGSDLMRALDTQATDPNSGGQVSLYNEQKPFRYRQGVEAFVAADGSRVLRTQFSDGQYYELPLATDSGDSIGLYASQLALWNVLEGEGLSYYMEALFGVKDSPWQQESPAPDNHASQVINAMLGGLSGYDGEILSEDDIGFIVWECQFLSSKGSFESASIETEELGSALLELGIKDEEGHLDLDQLRLAGSWMRRMWVDGEFDYEKLVEMVKGGL